MVDKRQHLVLASHNPGKLAELKSLLAENFILKPISDWTLESPAETATSFVENALIKARHAAKLTDCAALSDDSGLIVPALGGAPGVFSARYAGLDQKSHVHCDKLLRAMDHLPQASRQAFFYCVIVLLRAPLDPSPIIAEGRWLGRILTEPQGLGGFGYDPIFAPDLEETSAAMLSVAQKNQQSHRAKAIAALKQKLAHVLCA